MKIKHGLFLSALVLLIFITACTTGSGGGTPTSTKAFLGGQKGLALDFFPQAPPDFVFDTNYPFSINLRVENVGEWDVAAGDAVFTVTGINPTDFGVSAADLQANSPDELLGAQRDPNGNVIQGTVTNVEFPNLQYAGAVAGQVQFNVKVEGCYKYGTKTQVQLCILEDFLGRRGETSACNPNEEKTAENSGGPVHVTSFSESVVGSNKLSFFFTLRHVGDGRAYAPGTHCSTELSDRDKVKITLTDPGLGDLSCSGLEGGALEGLATLYQGERSIRCTLTVADENLRDYETVLPIVIEYDYKDSVEVPLVVKHGS